MVSMYAIAAFSVVSVIGFFVRKLIKMPKAFDLSIYSLPFAVYGYILSFSWIVAISAFLSNLFIASESKNEIGLLDQALFLLILDAIIDIEG